MSNDGRCPLGLHLGQQSPVNYEYNDTAALELATTLMERLRGRGTGAARQRAVYDHAGSVAHVVDYLSHQVRT